MNQADNYELTVRGDDRVQHIYPGSEDDRRSPDDVDDADVVQSKTNYPYDRH